MGITIRLSDKTSQKLKITPIFLLLLIPFYTILYCGFNFERTYIELYKQMFSEPQSIVQGQMYHIPKNLASNVNLSYCMNLWT